MSTRLERRRPSRAFRRLTFGALLSLGCLVLADAKAEDVQYKYTPAGCKCTVTLPDKPTVSAPDPSTSQAVFSVGNIGFVVTYATFPWNSISSKEPAALDAMRDAILKGGHFTLLSENRGASSGHEFADLSLSSPGKYYWFRILFFSSGSLLLGYTSPTLDNQNKQMALKFFDSLTLADAKSNTPVLSQTAAGAQGGERPIFSFQGDDTESVSNLSGQANCSTTGSQTSCTDMNNPTLAGRPMRFITRDFYNGKLYHAYALFGDGAYSSVLSAFVAKYGAPSATEVRKWQSKAGAVFDNQVAIWRFRGGNLELESMGLEVGTGSFDFLSMVNSPPADAPKVDF